MQFSKFDDLLVLKQSVLIVLLYGVVCALDYDWKGVLSHTLFFSVFMASVLFSERTSSIFKAIRSIHEKSNRIYLTTFFSLVTVGIGVYLGYTILRALIEAIFVFMFFLAFSGIDMRLSDRK